MLRTTASKLVCCLVVTPLGLLLAGCATAVNPDRPFATAAETPVESAMAAIPPQGPSIAQIHPRTMITLGAALGETDFEINDGTQILSTSSNSYTLRLRAEHFWESELGVFFSGNISSADEIAGPNTSYDSLGAFLAVSFRATMDDDFRMPVRFGPYLYTSDQEDPSLVGDLTRQIIGMRLSAEPEYIIFQRESNGKLSELSVFAEISCGAGPTNIDGTGDFGTGVISADEDGYAFSFNWEFGVRYKLPMGLLAGLSVMQEKNHFATTETFNQVAFFGLDEDFTGVCLTVGARF